MDVLSADAGSSSPQHRPRRRRHSAFQLHPRAHRSDLFVGTTARLPLHDPYPSALRVWQLWERRRRRTSERPGRAAWPGAWPPSRAWRADRTLKRGDPVPPLLYGRDKGMEACLVRGWRDQGWCTDIRDCRYISNCRYKRRASRLLVLQVRHLLCTLARVLAFCCGLCFSSRVA